MADFDSAFAGTSVYEGSYANHPNDKGGETYRGIARAYNPSWEGWPVIDSQKTENDFPLCLDRDNGLQTMVRNFFKKLYWNPLKADLIPDQELANELYDNGVNMGIKTSARYFQKTLNILNGNGKYYADLSVDGVIGPKTIEAYNKSLARNGKEMIYNVLNGYQIKHYIEWMERNPSQEVFRGVFKRVKISWSGQ